MGEGPQWTADLVLAGLVEAMRRGLLAGSEDPLLELLDATEVYLGRHSPERHRLIQWARSVAAGHSTAAMCRAMSWERGQFLRSRARWVAKVVDGLNGDSVNVPKDLLTLPQISADA